MIKDDVRDKIVKSLYDEIIETEPPIVKGLDESADKDDVVLTKEAAENMAERLMSTQTIKPRMLIASDETLLRMKQLISNMKPVKVKPRNIFTRLFWRFIKVKTYPQYIERKEK